MSYKFYVDLWQGFVRFALKKNHEIITYKLFKPGEKDRIGTIISAKIERLVPSLSGAFVDFGGEEPGFIKIRNQGKKPIARLHEGQKLVVEIEKEQSEGKYTLLREASHYKPIDKIGIILKEPLSPFLRFIELFQNDTVESVTIQGELFAELQKELKARPIINRLKFYPHRDLFEINELEENFDLLLDEEVPLQGGSLLIEEIKTLTAIDVNMGDDLVAKSFEEAAFQFNRKIISSILDHIRWRNIGGLIVIDFLRLRNLEYKQYIYNIMKMESQKDWVKIDVLGFTKAGLFEITRYNDRQSLKKFLKTYVKSL